MTESKRTGMRPSIALSDLPAPSLRSSEVVSLQAPASRLTPEQHIYFYSADDWEEFVKEWASSLDVDYFQVKRLGGSNDRGIDVAGLLTERGLEGPWDCYQCKHYSKPVQKGEAFQEIMKIFAGIIEGSYIPPRRYRILAPRGCSPSLDRLFVRPTELKQAFLQHAASRNSIRDYGDTLVAAITAHAEDTDFSIFNSEDIVDVLTQHSTTQYHAWRFALPLDTSRDPVHPPDTIDPSEVRYIAQLIDAYRERSGGMIVTRQDIGTDRWYTDHLNRQRFSFYSAESLRLFARDKVPSGTFESLQEEIYSGVVETEQASYGLAVDRLTAVLEAAIRVELNANLLIQALQVNDRKGICHQLANEDRLRWSQ
jgi:hypothetical protein